MLCCGSRQREGHLRPLAGFAGNRHVAFVMAHDGLTDTEAQPQVVRCITGGIERISEPLDIVWRDTLAVVPNYDSMGTVSAFGRYLDFAGLPVFAHGRDAIEQQVNEHLGQGRWIAGNGRSLRNVSLKLDTS